MLKGNPLGRGVRVRKHICVIFWRYRVNIAEMRLEKLYHEIKHKFLFVVKMFR